MNNMLIFFLFLLRLNNIFCQSFCYIKGSNEFINIDVNNPLKVKIGPNEEYCFKYKLKDKKNKIALTFMNGISYTTEVLIYDSFEKIQYKENNYDNYNIKYNIGNESFKEIDVHNFEQFVYIIIRDSKYYFIDYILLYDSEIDLPLEPGVPLSVKNFMSNNEYNFYFSSSKDVTIILTSKIQGNKLMIIYKDNEQVLLLKDDNVIILKYESSLNQKYKVTIKNEAKNDQDFNIIFYENVDEFQDLKLEQNYKFYYLNFKEENSERPKFYFSFDITDLKDINSINFKFDYNVKKNKNYINIYTKIKQSDKILSSKDFKVDNFSTNELNFEYDLYSDEYLKYYFNAAEYTQYKFKYILIKIEINPYIYTIPKSFNISIGKELEHKDLTNENYMQINTISESYIPTYLQLSLNQSSKYLLNIPCKDEIMLIKGNLLNENLLNKKNIIKEQTDLYEIENLSELSIRIFGYESNNILNIQKYPDNLIIFNEKERTDKVYSHKFEENECKSGKMHYLIYKYNIYETNSIIKYWMIDDEAQMNVYYKNNTNFYDNNFFPNSNNKYELEKETEFIANTNIDIFGIICSKPGTLYIRPTKKKFQQTTHELKINTISKITIVKKKEIIQPIYPIKNSPKKIYFSLLSLKGKKINLKPDTDGLFENTIIDNTKLFKLEIDIKKFKMDQMAIALSLDESTDIEVTQTTDLEIHQYQNIKNDDKKVEINKNNFVIFLENSVKALKIKFNKIDNVEVAYGIVKLATDDIKYIPLAFNFNETNKETMKTSIELNNLNNITKDNYKPFTAFIFSVRSNSIIDKYNIEIDIIRNTTIIFMMNVILVTSLIISFVLAILFLIYLFNLKKLK